MTTEQRLKEIEAMFYYEPEYELIHLLTSEIRDQRTHIECLNAKYEGLKILLEEMLGERREYEQQIDKIELH